MVSFNRTNLSVVVLCILKDNTPCSYSTHQRSIYMINKFFKKVAIICAAIAIACSVASNFEVKYKEDSSISTAALGDIDPPLVKD